MAAGDPVCNIKQRVPVASPQIPNFPAIPKAWDLPSALRAIQALTQIVQILTSQYPGNQFNQGDTLVGGASKKDSASNGDFTEMKDRRQTKETRIYDPNDKEVFVDVKQITGLTFFDKVSKHFVKWER